MSEQPQKIDDVSAYTPVPVEVAREIGGRYAKQIVVVMSWDDTCGRFHTTTWGLSARHKEWAAELGVQLARAAGADLGRAEHFEDFRCPSASAQNAEKCESHRVALLNIEATARKWAVSAGGDTPLALIAKIARDELGMTVDQVDAVLAARKEPKP